MRLLENVLTRVTVVYSVAS